MIIESKFKPAWWLTNPHAQTMYPSLARRQIAAIDYSERFELPDGDFIDLAWAVNGLKKDAPLVILLHGLGGGIRSAYVAGLLSAFNKQGWRAMLMHFRGAGSELNRLPRAYHSGDTNDLSCLINALSQREPTTKKAVVGISLGGNVLLKWLGEQREQSLVQAGVAVSVPFQLRLAADRMNHGLSRIYQSYLLRGMRCFFDQKMKANKDKMPPSMEKLNSINCFWTFDEFITAPLHGFASVHSYYRESSSRQYLASINTPTLIIHSLDDPFMTPEIIPGTDELSDEVTLELSRKGGHVGFISGHIPGVSEYWLDQRIPDYLKNFLD
jgi:predicted alpha/beta-fold hydrolase